MPSEMKFVTFKEFVKDLNSSENSKPSDVSVICNESDGPRSIFSPESAVKAIGKYSKVDFNDTDVWEQGGIVGSSGNPYTTTSRLRTKTFHRLYGDVVMKLHNSATTSAYAYTENEEYIGTFAYTNTGTLEAYVASHPSATKFKICIVCQSDVLPSELATYATFTSASGYNGGRFFGLAKLIEDEKNARESADSTLTANLNSEVTARQNLEGKVDEMENNFFTQLTLSVTEGKYRNPWGTSFTDYEGSAYAQISVKEGEKYSLSARVGTNIRTYVICNSSGTITRSSAIESWTTTHNYDVEVTIAEGEATMYVNSFGSSYLGVRKTGSFPSEGSVNYAQNSINGDALKDNSVPQTKIQGGVESNPLFGKTAVFDGDSICHGTTGLSPSDPKYAWGWAGRIGTKNGMTWKNYGISGGTVTSETYSWTKFDGTPDWDNQDYYTRKGGSVATDVVDQYVLMTSETWDGVAQLYTKGAARHWESSDIDTIYSEYPDADYVILEACFNDAFQVVPKGTISETFTDTFSKLTYCSAFESMLQQAITKFPSAKIGVIIPYKPSSDINSYQDLALEICEKWNIPVIDLRKISGLAYPISAQRSVMFYDSTHINQDGYDFITPKIEAWMKTL